MKPIDLTQNNTPITQDQVAHPVGCGGTCGGKCGGTHTALEDGKPFMARVTGLLRCLFLPHKTK